MTQVRRRAMRYVRTSQQRRVARGQRWALMGAGCVVFALALALLVG